MTKVEQLLLRYEALVDQLQACSAQQKQALDKWSVSIEEAKKRNKRNLPLLFVGTACALVCILEMFNSLHFSFIFVYELALSLWAQIIFCIMIKQNRDTMVLLKKARLEFYKIDDEIKPVVDRLFGELDNARKEVLEEIRNNDPPVF